MKPDADAQRLIDLLNPLAAQLRLDNGPDDGALFLLARFIDGLYRGEIKGRRPRSTPDQQPRRRKTVAGKFANGAPIKIQVCRWCGEPLELGRCPTCDGPNDIPQR